MTTTTRTRPARRDRTGSGLCAQDLPRPAAPTSTAAPRQLPARLWSLLRLAYERGWDTHTETDTGRVTAALYRGHRRYHAAWLRDPDDPAIWRSTAHGAVRDLPAYPLAGGLDDIETALRSSR